MYVCLYAFICYDFMYVCMYAVLPLCVSLCLSCVCLARYLLLSYGFRYFVISVFVYVYLSSFTHVCMYVVRVWFLKLFLYVLSSLISYVCMHFLIYVCSYFFVYVCVCFVMSLFFRCCMSV